MATWWPPGKAGKGKGFGGRGNPFRNPFPRNCEAKRSTTGKAGMPRSAAGRREKERGRDAEPKTSAPGKARQGQAQDGLARGQDAPARQGWLRQDASAWRATCPLPHKPSLMLNASVLQDASTRRLPSQPGTAMLGERHKARLCDANAGRVTGAKSVGRKRTRLSQGRLSIHARAHKFGYVKFGARRKKARPARRGLVGHVTC